jgi:hypothetical protein
MRVCQGRLSRGSYQRTHPTRPSTCRALIWLLPVTAARGPVTACGPVTASGTASEPPEACGRATVDDPRVACGTRMTCDRSMARDLATADGRPMTCGQTMGLG